MPLIVRWPGVTEAGSRCHEPVISADFYPTLLDAAGLTGDAAHNAAVEGVSNVPLLKSAKAKLGRDALCFHYPHYYPSTTPVSAIRAGDWKLIEFHEDKHVELYNLREDLGETKDLAPSTPERTRDLQSKLHAWQKHVSAQMPAPNRARR